MRKWFTPRRADLLIGGLAVLLWLRLFTVPIVPHETAIGMLDWSWQLCNAYFLKHAYHAGVQYIFPTTLLGYLYTRVYDPDVYGWYVACQFTLNGLLAYNLYRMAQSYADRRVQAGLLLICMFVTTLNLGVQTDIANYLTILTIAQALFSDACSPKRSLVNTSVLALLCCIKFTYLLVGVLIVLCASPIRKRQGAPWHSNPAGVFSILFVALWISLKQPLTNLPAYFKNMLAISLGYNEAMGVSSATAFLLAGILVLITSLFMVWQMQRRYPGHSALSAVVLSLLFAELWKHGFVRADGHMMMFFGCMSMLPLLLPVWQGAYRALPKWNLGLLTACTLLSLFCLLYINGRKNAKRFVHSLLHAPLPALKTVLLPLRAKQELDAQYMQEARRWHLPAIDARVGRATVDVISTSQFAVLFNDLNYHPRPVYQSYATYTPYLSRVNGDFYRSSDAPAYVLLDLNTIDMRWPTLDDSDALGELWKRYRPVLAEKQFVLLGRFERQADADETAKGSLHSPGPTPDSKPDRSGSDFPTHRQTGLLQPSSQSSALTHTARFQVNFGTEIPVEGGGAWHLLSVRMRPTLLGKLRETAIRPAPVYIQARFEDGTAIHRRLIPAMAQSNFLLDPYVENTGDFVSLYAGKTGKRVRSFHIGVESAKAGLWMHNPIEVVITSCPALTAPSLTGREPLPLPEARPMPQQ